MCDYTDCTCQVFSMLVFFLSSHLTSYFILIIPPTFVSVHRSWTKNLWILGHINASKPLNEWLLDKLAENVKAWPALRTVAPHGVMWCDSGTKLLSSKSHVDQCIDLVKLARDRKHERFPPNGGDCKGKSGKSRLVKYYNLPRIDELTNDFEWWLKKHIFLQWVIFSVWTVRGSNWRHAI